MGQSGVPLVTPTKAKLVDCLRTVGTIGSDWRVAKLLQSIDRNTGTVDWKLEQVCRELELDISPAYAARLFKSHTGWGVREFAKKKRLTKAVEQLIVTNLPVKAIAAELGYRNSFDFTRSFEKQYCLTPTKFRKTNRLRLSDLSTYLESLLPVCGGRA
jgi:AraC-like DNA-binding protein